MLSQVMLDQFAAAERERQVRIGKAWDAYHGRHPQPLRVKPGRPDDNVILNFARLVVDKGASFLFGSELGFEVDGQGKSDIDTWLSQAWDANRRMTTLHRLALNGGIAGSAFVRILPRQPYPRLVVLDPACVTVRWRADDFEEVISYTIQWHGVDPATARPVAYRQVISHEHPEAPAWLIQEQESRGDAASWVTTAETVWPYAWAPILHCQNLPCPNEWWGISDLEEDLLGANRALNFVLSNLARIIRYHAHPKTWGSGFQASELKIGVDETIVLPSPDASLQNLEMVSDLTSSLELYKRLKEAFHELARVPEIATGKVEDVGALSGIALEILYQSLIEKTATKRLLYGELLQAVSVRMLEISGRGEAHTIGLHWPAVLPTDRKGEAETAVIHHDLGASRDTLLTRLGFDPQAEAEKRAEEAQADRELGDRLLKQFDRGETDPDASGDGEE